MASLTFADTNNLVAYLSKSDANAEDVIRQALYLDDADGVECLPNEEIFIELDRMGYEKPPPNAKRTAWNEFSCFMASAVICLATGRKFNFSKVGKGFLRVETPLFTIMLVQLKPPAAEKENKVEVPNAPTPPSLTTAPSPPLQDPIPTPPQAQPATPLESFKKLKAVKVSSSHYTQDTPTNDPKEMSEEDVKNMLEIIPVSEFNVEALQVKYPLIDWEIHSERSRSFWKIIRVGGITEAYQSFEDMLKGFDREDLRSSDEDFHVGQQTKEQEFGYILQVIKMKKLDGLLVSIAGTSSTEKPPLKDKYMWSDQEKKIQKINRLARSLLIQGLSNDIYSLIDSNKITKDLWDDLARLMLGSKYGEQDRKAAVLYEYETFKATKGELLLDTYIRYLQVINDLKKCCYSKDNCELNFKFLNNLQLEWKQYATMMRQNKNLMDINIDALYNILKQNQEDVNDAMRLKKKNVVVTSDPLALIAEKTKVRKRKEKVVVSLDSEGSDADDFCELKKITALLAKAFNKKNYSKPTNNNLRTLFASQSANKKQDFIKTDDKKVEKKDDEKKQDMSKVKCYNCKKEEASSSSADDKISKVSYYLPESESKSEYETSEYYHNTTTYGLFVNDNDNQEIFHDCENFRKNLIESQIDHNESTVDHNDSKGIDKLIRMFNKKIAKCLKRIEKANQQKKYFENQNKDLQDKYDVLKNQATTFEMKNKELNEQMKVLI
nr:hypothetical protein [Tanacetum cinerariifolium]